MRPRSRLAALTGAAVLVLALAAPAMAYSVPDQFAVNTAVQIQNLPAQIHYGALDPGQTSSVYTIDALVSANTNWSLTTTGSDFTSGLNTVSKGARQVLISTTEGPGSGLGFQVPPTASAWQTYADSTLNDGTPDVTGPTTAGLNVRFELRVVVPTGTPPSAPGVPYAGSITFLATGN